MSENVKRMARMVIHGARNISLTDKRDYSKHVPLQPSAEAEKRWQNLGLRMRDSMNRVVGEIAEAQ